jgi:hypothetical protein
VNEPQAKLDPHREFLIRRVTEKTDIIMLLCSSCLEVRHVALLERYLAPTHGGGANRTHPPERPQSAPSAEIDRAGALLANADGASYTAAAHLVGRGHNKTIPAWVSHFNREELATVRLRYSGGPRSRYSAQEQRRILAERARPPQREQDGSAAWSLSLLQKALRWALDGLPRVSRFTTAHSARGGSELAEEPRLVQNPRGAAEPQARAGARQRSRCACQKS